MDNINDMHYGSNSFTFQRAVELRNKMTKAEAVLWEYLRNNRFKGLKFRRQHPAGRFIVDFYCHKHKLVIELDGNIRELPSVKENDRNREEELRAFGLNIIRFSNKDVLQNIDATLKKLEEIIEHMEEKPSHPSPFRVGEQGVRGFFGQEQQTSGLNPTGTRRKDNKTHKP